jgi:hypothetical protein
MFPMVVSVKKQAMPPLSPYEARIYTPNLVHYINTPHVLSVLQMHMVAYNFFLPPLRFPPYKLLLPSWCYWFHMSRKKNNQLFIYPRIATYLIFFMHHTIYSSYFLFVGDFFTNIAFGTYFWFADNIYVAIVPFSNQPKNNGTDMKKLFVVMMWPLPPNSLIRSLTTFCHINPSPFLFYKNSASRKHSASLSLQD